MATSVISPLPVRIPNSIVHKFLLVTKGGGFFQRAICGGFPESYTSTIDLPHDEPETVARLLLHIYTGSYGSANATTQDTQLPRLEDVTPEERELDCEESERDSEQGENNSEETSGLTNFDRDQIMTHVKVFAIAAKYGIRSLEDQARRAFVHDFVKKIDSHCLDGDQYFGEIVRAVYTTTPSGERDLRDLCLFEILYERDYCRPECVKSGSRTLLEIFQKMPDVAVDAGLCWLDRDRKRFKWPYACGACTKVMSWIVGPCLCKKWRGVCNEKLCTDARIAASICHCCGRKGVLRRRFAVAG